MTALLRRALAPYERSGIGKRSRLGHLAVDARLPAAGDFEHHGRRPSWRSVGGCRHGQPGSDPSAEWMEDPMNPSPSTTRLHGRRPLVALALLAALLLPGTALAGAPVLTRLADPSAEGGSLDVDRETTQSAPGIAAAASPIVTAISAGSLHSCALLADHTVWCWGNNGYGQLGDGTTTSPPHPGRRRRHQHRHRDQRRLRAHLRRPRRRHRPLLGWQQPRPARRRDDDRPPRPRSRSPASATATRITAGERPHLRPSRGRYRPLLGQWQLRPARRRHDWLPALTPVAVSGISTATAIAAGYEHTCALLADGTPRCWG